jgi:molecular chaperone Hsp33
MQEDFIQNFIFKNRSVRGSFVRLNQSYKTIINQHHYPALLSHLLGEALLGVCLMSPFFKTAGKITLQFQGEGDLRFLSARMTSDFKIRGLVRAEPSLLSTQNLQEALKSGQLMLTYEARTGQPYQSIIPIETDSVAHALEDYFIRSEQLPTRFFLATGEDCVAGLMLQILPNVQQTDAYRDFEHCTVLASTLQKEELLEQDPMRLLQHLFVEDDITVFFSQDLEFGCNCSHERMKNAVLGLGREEALSILETAGFVEVVCEFCSQSHQFNEEEVHALFSSGVLGSSGSGQQSPRPHFDA